MTRDLRAPPAVCSSLPGLLLIAASGLLGCSEDDSSRVTSEQLLSELTVQQTLELCDHFNAITVGDPEYVRGACSSVGLVTAAAKPDKSCEQARDECTAELPMDRVCWLDPRNPRAEDERCPTTTAGELTSCFEGMAANTIERYAGVTCSDPSSNVVLADALDVWQNLKERPLPGCEALVKSCPEFFDPPDTSSEP